MLSRCVVRGLLLCGVLVTSQAQASDYAFFSPYNGSGVLLTAEHWPSAREACISVEGHLYAASTPIESATYDPDDGTCYLQTSSGAVHFPTITAHTGSCPGDVLFDYDGQRCLDVVNAEQLFSLLAALFAWFCFASGLLVGYRFGS